MVKKLLIWSILWDIEIDVNFPPIPIEQLDGIKINAATMAKLDGFIVADIEEDNGNNLEDKRS